MLIYKKYQKEGGIHWQWYLDDPAYKAWVDFIVALFPDKGYLFDIGCGDGLFSDSLFNKGLDVTGIDSSEYGIKIARDRAQGKFYVCEAEAFFNLRAVRYFEYCLATEVIEHLQDPMTIVNIFERHVARFMILTTPDAELDSRHSPNHYREHTKAEIKELFKKYKVEFLKTPGLHGKWSDEKSMVVKISK